MVGAEHGLDEEQAKWESTVPLKMILLTIEAAKNH
jgi:hypothetical protein